MTTDNSATTVAAPDFTAGQPPEWDLEIFKHGDEVQTALITLERNRRTFGWKCAGVDDAGMRQRVGRSAVTLGGLLKHLALCEELNFRNELTNQAPLEEFSDLDHESTWETWAWESAADDDADTLRDLWQRSVHRSRASVAAAINESGLDFAPEGGMSLRRLLSDMIEEYARHTGHADLIRESIDGETGEGPPQNFPVP